VLSSANSGVAAGGAFSWPADLILNARVGDWSGGAKGQAAIGPTIGVATPTGRIRTDYSACQRSSGGPTAVTPPPTAPAEPSGPRAVKPLRVDARRNRARVLDAAEAVFAAKGTAASTEEIARQAGVGIGTVFRHYPTKEALLEAVLADRLRQLADEVDALASAEDPSEALASLFTRAVDRASTKLALVDTLTAAGVEVTKHATSSQVGQRLLGALGTLLTRAQQSGSVRDDIGVTELIALLVGTSRAVEQASWDPLAQARILAVVLDGLRAARHR
jgi:AcrR family transcriptional regulator